MSYQLIGVIFLVNLSNMLIQSLSTERTTIDPFAAAAEFNRRIKLIEAGYNVSDSIGDLPIESISNVDNAFQENNEPRFILKTTFHPNFITNVKRPFGYHKQILMNMSSNIQKSVQKNTTAFVKRKSYRWTPYANYDSSEERELQKECPQRINHIIRLKKKHGITEGQSVITETKHLETTTTRWTPYPNYDSSEERELQKECPQRINHIRRLKAKHDIENNPVSYSSESVPSSCACNAGNWSQPYDSWEKWKEKECKPGWLNLQYGLNQDGTKFRKGHEPQWYLDEQEAKAGSKISESLSRQHRPKSRSGKHKSQGQQPSGYNHQYMGYPLNPGAYRMLYPQQPVGYPPQQMVYPPPYYPYPIQANIPQHYFYNNHPNKPLGIDPLAYDKLEKLHQDVKELKEKTTVSLWEQYLKLKEKFEPFPQTSTVSAKERYENYRRAEKQEPFFSKIKTDQSQFMNYRPRVNEYYQRSHNQDVQRSAVNPREELKVTATLHYQQHREQIYKNEPFNRFHTGSYQRSSWYYSPRPYYRDNTTVYNRMYSSVSYTTRQPPRNIYQREGHPTGWSYRQPEGYFTRYSRSEYLTTDAHGIHSTSTLKVTRTLPSTEPSSSVASDKGGTTIEVHKKYTAQYEFTEDDEEKRRLLTAREKEMKRKLYKLKLSLLVY